MADLLLEIQNLSKSYGAVTATKNLSLRVERGSIHALIGPNGAGKTSLVNQLTGDIMPDEGNILYNSKDITNLKDYQRTRLGIARSFQITHIFTHLSVAENMALAIHATQGHCFRFWRNALTTRTMASKLKAALERVGLLDRADSPAHELSHGEKRQLEVGMALNGEPELLILDEPMAGMGPGGTVELAKLIEELKGSLTILLVEHDMDVVFSLADMVTVLVYGENILTATPGEVQMNEKVRLAYLGEVD